MGWRDLWDVATGAEQRRGEALDERLADLNQRKRERGEWTWEQYNQAEANRAAGATGNTRSEVLGAAAEGAAEGLADLPGRARAALSGVAGWTIAWVPWWGWLAGLVALAWYLGAFSRLRGILNRK